MNLAFKATDVEAQTNKCSASLLKLSGKSDTWELGFLEEYSAQTFYSIISLHVK